MYIFVFLRSYDQIEKNIQQIETTVKYIVHKYKDYRYDVHDISRFFDDEILHLIFHGIMEF